MSIMNIPEKLPLIYLPNDVLLPGASMKIPLVKNKSLHLASLYVKNKANEDFSPVVGVVPFRNQQDFQISKHTIGTAAMVVRLTSNNWPEDTFVLTVVGLTRIKIKKILSEEPYPLASTSIINTSINSSMYSEELAILMQDFKKKAARLLDTVQENIPFVAKLKYMVETFPNHFLIDFCASLATSTVDEKWDILKTIDIYERLKKVIPLIDKHLDEFDGKELKVLMRKDRPVIKVIGPSFLEAPMHKPRNDSVDELEEKLKNASLPEPVAKVVDRELKRLKRMGPFNAEQSVQHNYLELIAELPWSVRTQDTINIEKAKKDLESDHYGMDRVKRRVVEFLAVRRLKSDLKGPILCFSGPPGVGKTSIGRSIASTLGRKFHRISLGGVSTQSEIRGHRRTYVGALPGRIIQALRTVSVKNPVILLDEVDKLTSGVNGDPSAALLEVLDPEQNHQFVDHFLNLPFDLSEVLFIATANNTSRIPPALRDRMEIIAVSGYTLDEKKNIAERHLFPKQLKEHGLVTESVSIPEEILVKMITGYTREAGVRGLERALAAVCRHAAVARASQEDISANQVVLVHPLSTIVIDQTLLEEILGPQVYHWGVKERVSGVVGVAVGLCWTESGGDLMVVEASKVEGGSGQLVLTGYLGKVMRESARLAINWVRASAHSYELVGNKTVDILAKNDVHIHFPAGAVGKDGPSAGITIAAALISLFSGIPIVPNLAMTGEITLRGVVLPVGGVKEKLISAHRGGIKKVLLPTNCKERLSEIPQNVLDSMEVVLVSTMDEVIDVAFEGALTLKHNAGLLSSKL